jgi:glycogen phosphorylase
VEVAVRLNGLTPSDVCVELLLSRGMRETPVVQHSHELAADGTLDTGEQRYRIDLKPGLAGRLDYRIRVFPRHELLTHPCELGLACWV